MKLIEEAEDQLLQANTVKYTAPVVEEKPVITREPREPDYIPFVDNPPVQSVGNSGWQVSDGKAGYPLISSDSSLQCFMLSNCDECTHCASHSRVEQLTG